LTQRMLADFAGIGLSTIVRAERSEPIGADARRRICEYLGKSSEELGLVPAATSEQASVTPRLTSFPADEEDAMNRRQALQKLGLAGAAVFLGSRELFSPEPWERLSQALAGASSIDIATISHLEGITNHYWHLRADVPSRELLSGVVGHLQTVTQL